MLPFIAASVSTAISALQPARSANSSIPSMLVSVLSQSKHTASNRGRCEIIVRSARPVGWPAAPQSPRALFQECRDTNHRNRLILPVGDSDLHPRDIDIL